MANVVSIEVNVRSYSTTAYRTSITQDALDVRYLGTGTMVRVAGVMCSASGPDIALPPSISSVSPPSGSPSGGPVFIYGSNLCGPISVMFGSVSAVRYSANSSCTQISATAPAGTGSVPVRVTTAGGVVQAPVPFTYSSAGYWMVAADGGVFSYGSARFFGSTGGIMLAQPIVAMASTPDRRGYWLFAADGGVFAFGDAAFFGSVPGALGAGRSLNQPVVAAEATPDGRGYRLFAADGGVFAFGDAGFVGSLPGLGVALSEPIVGATSAPAGQGYWLVARDGGVFSFGSAPFQGSLVGRVHSGSAVSIAATAEGSGYWLVTSTGTTTPFGGASAFGQLSAPPLHPVVAIGADSASSGYWLFADDGGVFAFGAAPFLGSLGGVHLNRPVVGGAGF